MPDGDDPPPPPDVPRQVADLSDIQRCADSKKDDVMDRTPANTQSWIAFRFQFYMALITRCNGVWSQLNTLDPFSADGPCVSHRYEAGALLCLSRTALPAASQWTTSSALPAA